MKKNMERKKLKNKKMKSGEKRRIKKKTNR